MCGYSRDWRKKTQSIRTGEKFKFYLNGLDQVLEVEPIDGLDQVLQVEPIDGLDQVLEVEPIDGLDQVLEVEPIVIEGLNHAMEKSRSVNHIQKITERRIWSGVKISIPEGSAILLKITIEGDWKGEGFVESMLPEEQDSGRKLVLPETANKLSVEVQGVENHMEEEI